MKRSAAAGKKALKPPKRSLSIVQTSGIRFHLPAAAPLAHCAVVFGQRKSHNERYKTGTFFPVITREDFSILFSSFALKIYNPLRSLPPPS